MSDPFGGEMRKLPFPLDQAVSLSAETPDPTGNIALPEFPEDSAETITILHRWSLQEFVAMATCIDVGSDIAFGSQAIRMWWIWSTSMVELCAEMIRCIEETEAVREALANWFSDAVDNNTIVQQALQRAFNPATPGTEVPDEYANQNQYGQALGCDLDDGWGHIRDGLIERSFQRVIDVLEQIENVTNNQEMLAQFLNAIPGIGAVFDVVPVTDWVLWFDNVRAWMKETFEAADTVDLRDQIACDLFCIWQIDCSLSLEQIRRYYWNKTESLVPEWEGAFESMSSLATALGFLSQVDFGAGVVYALVGSQYGFLTFINDWFGISVNAVGSDLALGEPSDDHLALCPTCPEEQAYAVGLFDLCDSGALDTADFEAGVPFELQAIEIGSSGSFYLALVLPAGNWTVTLDSFIGTVTQPADLNQDAYSYWNTGGVLQHIQWNAPGNPDEFGTHDVSADSFAPWCAGQGFYLVLFNEAPFSAIFTAVAI